MLHLGPGPLPATQSVLVEKSPTGWGIDFTFDCTGNVQARRGRGRGCVRVPESQQQAREGQGQGQGLLPDLRRGRE